jgi:hypothetical protein
MKPSPEHPREEIMGTSGTVRLLAIDPSIRNLGWAFCELGGLGASVPELARWRYGVIRPKGKDDPQRWYDAIARLGASLGPLKPTHCALEWPAHFNSLRGEIAAHRNYTIGLAAIATAIAIWFRIPPENIALFIPSVWKGSVPKGVTARKFARTFPSAKELQRKLSDHEIDALMIAQYWISTR